MNLTREHRVFGRELTNLPNIEHAMNKVNLNDKQSRPSLDKKVVRNNLDIVLEPIEEESPKNPQMVEEYTREISQYTIRRESSNHFNGSCGINIGIFS